MKLVYFFRTCILFGITINLTGCSTTANDVKKGTPVTFESVKSAKVLASCIGDGWEKTAFSTLVKSRPTQKGYQVQISEVAIVHMLAEIVDITEGRSVTFFWIGPDVWLDSSKKITTNIVSICQNN